VSIEGNQKLYDKAALGKIVEEFQSSEVGRYLIKRAEEAVEDAVEKLKVCDPKDGKVVQSLQNQVWKAESFQQWLADAIIDGANALDLITNGE
jgi:hypothetical protein